MIKEALPEGWQVVKLGDVLSVSSGKGLKVHNLEGGLYPVYGGNGINGYHSEYFLEEQKLIIGRVGVKCGVTYITKFKSWVTDNALIVNLKTKELDLRFLKLKLDFENLNKLSVSTAQPVISGSKIFAYEISLPPLSKQHLIVEKIEELFSELDKSLENLKTSQQQLKVYRQAVLKWAFEGKLTNEIVKDGELPEGWEVKEFGEVVINFDGKRVPLSSKYRETFKGSFPYYGACDIIDYVKDYIFDGNYILIGEDGANLLSKNKPLAFIVHGKFWVNNHAHICQPKDFIDFKFLEQQFQSKNINQYISGTAQPKLNQANLNKIPIIVPPIKEQNEIVQEIESRLSVCDKMEETITTSLQQVEALRQSILKKAFEGKLVKR